MMVDGDEKVGVHTSQQPHHIASHRFVAIIAVWLIFPAEFFCSLVLSERVSL
jgi:hypothetical protein